MFRKFIRVLFLCSEGFCTGERGGEGEERGSGGGGGHEGGGGRGIETSCFGRKKGNERRKTQRERERERGSTCHTHTLPK